MNDWEKKPLLRPSEEGQGPIRLSILGDFELGDAGGHQFPIATKKNRALLAVLALSPGFQATRERLCGLLWGDRGDDQARSSLRQSLAVLRKELGGVEDLVLKTHDDIVALRRDTAQVDAIDFLALSNDSGITTLRQAAKLYRGELLGDTSIRDAAFEDWLSTERSRLRTVAIKIFDRLIPLEEGHSRIVAAQQLVSFDPLRESSHRLLMQAYADQGDNGLALKQFELCRKLLHEELSVEPAKETLELRRQIAEGNRKSITQENAQVEAKQALRAEQFPSIAVLPFLNLSGDPEQDYFAEGITEDITTELSRFHQFKIQARTAAALFHGSEADALNAGRELGVRYFVSGSVRRLGQRLRISARLVDAHTGSQVWAERFDRSEEDLFAVQDEVIRTIVSTLAGRAEAAGAEQTKRRHPGSLGAYECVLRAETLPLYDHKTQIEARALYEKAIGLDPVYARPHAMLANLDVIDWMEDMSGSDAILDCALELAKKSVLLDENDATCQMTLGAIYSNLRSFQLAEHHYQRAMDLNRNNPLVVATVGTLRLYRGDAVNAVKVFEEARILDPFFEPSWYWPTLGIARFALGQYREAIALLERSPNRPHWVTAYLAASFSLIGEEHRASQAAAETQRTLPSFLSERFTAKEWPPDSDTGKKLLDGLRKAGLPETSTSSLARMDEKPSIAVLPFVNLSGDPQHDYFADGITEDITTELSRFKGLFVIARNSAFSFKAKSIAIATIANELGVQFLLEGSVQRSGDRVRVTARLVDAATGREAWSERYDRVIEDIFAVQDNVVRTIVATLEGQLASTVASQSRRQTPSNILAYECVLQARKFLDVYDAHSAEPLLRRAIAADPRYAQANAWMAMVYWVKFFNDHREKDIAEAVAFGKTAVALDPGDSVCHMQLGFAYIFSRQLELADIHSLKALELNPADMLALGLRAQLLCRLGRSQEAIEALDQLVRHDPFPPNWYWENRSIVLLTLDKFEEALAAIRHMPELFWWNHGYVAICCARLGRIKEAKDAIKHALELRPELTIQRFMMGEPYKLLEDANRMIEGLRMAGLAEHAAVSSTRSGTKPSIAVLSFVNLSGDAQQDYLADGLAEDVIAGLSRFSSLVVISQNSSFRFRSGSTDAKFVGKELGVQYLVTGNLRRVGQRIRINAQLTDTASGVQLWSEKYERNVEDFLEVQDDVVRAIATTFEHRIADIRAQEISNQPAATWEAYDHFLQARQLMSHYSNYPAAEAPLLRAIALDPSFSEAHARLAHVAMSKYWANGDQKHIEQALIHAKTAIRLNDRNSAAHTAMSVVSAFMNNYDLAFLHADRALELNPNNTQAAKNRAMWQVYVGKSAEALAAFDTMLMRDPYPTANSWEIKGAALFQLRRYEEAVKVFSMFSELQYWDRAYLIASHIRLGNNTNAKNEVSALLQLHPEFSISRVLQAENYADEVSREHLRRALLEAGLPEYANVIEAEADQ